MKLEDYLKAIKECPDKIVDFSVKVEPHGKGPMLTVEWGIADNFEILLGADTDGVIKYLKETQKYIDLETNKKGTYLFNYSLGTIRLGVNQISNYINTTFLNVDPSLYVTSISLHPYQHKKIPDVEESRAIAMVVEDLGQFILKENIPAIMPWSVGDRYVDSDWTSRIVMHNPVGDIVSPYLRVKK